MGDSDSRCHHWPGEGKEKELILLKGAWSRNFSIDQVVIELTEITK